MTAILLPVGVLVGAVASRAAVNLSSEMGRCTPPAVWVPSISG